MTALRARHAAGLTGFGFFFLVGAGEADAQSGPIKNNQYTVEFFQGPLLAPTNVEALAGATTAVADGVNGGAVNAAAPAVRQPFSMKWLDLDVDLGVSFPGAYTKMDYDDHGPGSIDQVNDFLYANAGIAVQLGELGLAASADLLRYQVVGRGGLDVTAGRYHVLAAYGFFENQVVVGGGFRAVTMQLSEGGSALIGGLNPVGASLTMSGLGPELGMIWKPNELPLRIGATLRTAVTGSDLGTGKTTTDLEGVVRSGGVIVPSAVTMPWEIETGFALQIGPRPLNPAWLNPDVEEEPLERRVRWAREARAAQDVRTLEATDPAQRPARQAELAAEEAAIRVIEEQHLALEKAKLLAERKARYENWPREKILVVASLLVTGASPNAIALEDFFDQRIEAYGEHATYSPRVGLEAEPIPSWLKGRVGSYLEPSRFSGIAARQHFTTGADVKLFAWDAFGLTRGQVWRVSAVADVAPRYTNWGLSVGAWH